MSLFICLVPIFCIDLTNFVFEIFENCYCQFDFAAVFEVDDRKHQNILSTKIFNNSLRFSHYIPWSPITLYLRYVIHFPSLKSMQILMRQNLRRFYKIKVKISYLHSDKALSAHLTSVF